MEGCLAREGFAGFAVDRESPHEVLAAINYFLFDFFQTCLFPTQATAAIHLSLPLSSFPTFATLTLADQRG